MLIVSSAKPTMRLVATQHRAAVAAPTRNLPRSLMATGKWWAIMPAPKPTRTPAKATPRTRAIAISVVFLVNLAIGLFLHAEWMTDCDRAAMRFEWWRIAARDRGCARKLLLNAGFFAHGTLPPGADAG